MPPRYRRSRSSRSSALDVHLRIPASLNGEPLVGRRVVVPFGHRAMTGMRTRPNPIARSGQTSAHKRNRRSDGLAPGSPAETDRAGPLDKPLLSRARRRNIPRDAPSRNRAAPRSRIFTHRIRPRLPQDLAVRPPNSLTKKRRVELGHVAKNAGDHSAASARAPATNQSRKQLVRRGYLNCARSAAPPQDAHADKSSPGIRAEVHRDSHR